MARLVAGESTKVDKKSRRSPVINERPGAVARKNPACWRLRDMSGLPGSMQIE